MPVDRFANDEGGASDTRAATLWVLPPAFLVGLGLWLAFSSGGYSTGDWAFPAMALGVAGMAAAALAVFPRRPRQLSLAVLALYCGYAVWVLASNIWAGSTDSAWQATGRTFMYVLALALALTFFTSSRAQKAFKQLVMAGALVLLAACIWQLWTTGDLASLFVGNRLTFPVGHANAAAALFLIPFWPLLWLGAGPYEPAPVRGVALGLATGLVGLALMTQSRAAAWSLGITLILLFVLSPGRLRLLLYLLIPVLLMVYAFPMLNAYWTEGTETLSGGTAARTLTVAALAAGFMGMIVALLEKWIKVSGRMKAIFGTVVLAGCIAGLIYGAVTLTQDSGGPVAWFLDRWEELRAEPASDVPATTFLPDGTPTPAVTRADVWDSSWHQLVGDLPLGAGAGNPVAPSEPSEAQAGSFVLRVLGETGVVGGALAYGAMLLSLAGILLPRTVAGVRGTGAAWRARHQAARAKAGAATGGAPVSTVTRRPASRWGLDSMAYGWEMALLAAALFWFIHANLERLWEMAGITMPALLMLAAALAATDSRARTMWPRLSRRLRRKTAARGRSRRFPFGRPQPEGLLSEAFRIGLMVLSAAALVLAVSSYLLARL